jgi:methyltransferase
MLTAYNTKKLKQEGGFEIGKKHYPLFIVLHGSWLLAVFLTTSPHTAANAPLLAFFILLQLGRIWVIWSLGHYWTTRIIIVPHEPLVKRGIYHFVSHPNYIIVSLEIFVLPLIFSNWLVAVIWSCLNIPLLYWRIRVENQGLKLKTFT